MGLLLDIVPNHMAISPKNPFWTDLLEFGPDSQLGEFFDIDWELCGGKKENKIILPILGKPYQRALEEGEIFLSAEEGRLSISYF